MIFDGQVVIRRVPTDSLLVLPSGEIFEAMRARTQAEREVRMVPITHRPNRYVDEPARPRLNRYI